MTIAIATATTTPMQAGHKPKPVRLWPIALIVAVALFGALLEVVLPDGVYAEGRPVRLWIEAQGWPSILTLILTSAVRVWVSIATLVPVVGVGTVSGALLLAALNLGRMGQRHNAVMTALLGLVFATLPRAKLFGEGIYFGHWWVAALHVVVAIGLYRQQRFARVNFGLQARYSVVSASGLGGILIALLGCAAQSALSYLGLALAMQANLFFAGQGVGP